MNVAEAKNVLLAWRPGVDVSDSSVREALELAQENLDLREWWERQQEFQNAAQAEMRAMGAPEELRERILSRAKVVPVRFRYWRATLASAAGLIALLVVASLLKPPVRDDFRVFRSRMVGNVLRQYSMTLKTNDMEALRQQFGANRAPADYTVPERLATAPLLGGGVLSWQNQRVSMICYDNGKRGMLFLFVVDADSVPGAPLAPRYAPVSSLNTVSWTAAGKTYVLVGDAPDEALRELL